VRYARGPDRPSKDPSSGQTSEPAWDSFFFVIRYFENCVLGFTAVLCTGAAGSQKLPPPGSGAGLVGSTGVAGRNHPCDITAADARIVIENNPIAIGSRHQGRLDFAAGIVESLAVMQPGFIGAGRIK
jgi:hypothetical protein